MNDFTLSEKRVIQAMVRLGRYATANEIAKWANMSWNTADKVLEELLKRNIVISIPRNGKTYWLLNFKN